MRRVKITLDAARSLAYMLEQAKSSIIHQDIKSTNILLDDRWNAKVADFGIYKAVKDTTNEYITTDYTSQKGTVIIVFVTPQESWGLDPDVTAQNLLKHF